MKKTRVLALLCGLVLLMTSVVVALPTPSVQAAVGDTVYIRKHISLLYDNSGSMNQPIEGAPDVPNLKWCYASYAAQMFTGLLNDTDSLSFTFMNDVPKAQLPGSQRKKLEVDLTGDRQKQVTSVLNATNHAYGGTPIDSIVDANKVLVNKGLKSNTQTGGNQINQNEQYWLVLTTDGRFDEIRNTTHNDQEAEKALVDYLVKKLLSQYSNLQVVYFAIGTKGDESKQKAIDLSKNAELKAYPNFTAVYAADQTEIVSTMRDLANRISGRYSVTEGIQQDGNKVTIRVSSETSPIRNVAVLAQKTDATLLSATTEMGEKLTVSRPASILYPRNTTTGYSNMPAGTKGGTTALIINPDGKIPPGNVTLEFSKPVSLTELSLMYEPAIRVNLTLQTQDASGNWVDVPYGDEVMAEQPLRVNYEICEDGTNTPIDAAKLPGVTTAQISYGNGNLVEVNKPFQLTVGSSVITATVSMMDGSYVVSTSREVTAQSLSAYTYDVSAPLEFYPNDLATNTSQYIDFKIFHKGQVATADQLTNFHIDAGELQGLFTTPENGVFRFTPQDEARPVGDYTVALKFQNTTVATQTVKVKQEDLHYTAEAGDSLALFTNETADNQKPIVFTVMRHRGNTHTLMTEEDMGDFRVEALSADGKALKGEVNYQPDGQIHFTIRDGEAAAGDYVVALYWKDVKLAEGQASILQYNAVYTAEVFPIGDNTLDRFHLMDNENGLAFVVYADGEPLTANQLQAMLNSQQLLWGHNPDSDVMEMEITVGEHNGASSLKVIPTTKTKWGFWYGLQKPFIAVFGTLPLGSVEVTLQVQTVHGTSVTGVMEVVENPADWIFWLVIFLAILAVAVIIVWMIVSNILMPRIAPGSWEYIHIVITSGEQAIVKTWVGPQVHKRRFYLFRFIPTPERFDFEGLTFYAENQMGSVSNPQCRLEHTDPQLMSYYRCASTLGAGQLFAFLSANGRRCPKDQLRARLSNSPVVRNTKQMPTEAIYEQVDSGGYIMKRTGVGTNNENVEIWRYVQQADDPEE